MPAAKVRLATRSWEIACYVRTVVEYCVRCGGRDLDDPRFCFWCSDGEADEERAREVVEGARSGAHDPLRIIGDITDPRAFDVIAEAALDADPGVRRAALIALGGIADERGIPVAIAGLDHDEDLVRHAAIDALAEMGPGGADAIAARLADPRDRTQAARALAWLHDDRAFEPLSMMLDSDNLIGESIFGGETITAMGRLGGPDALAALDVAVDRVIRAADAGAIDWQARSAAYTIAQTLEDMRDPAATAVEQRLRARFDHLYVVPGHPPEPYRAPSHPQRTVPRWSFTLQAVDEPITEPVSKFGGQPVWIGDPTWPLEADGGPATFMAQFTIPGRDGLAYLFLDHAYEYPNDPGYVVVQPGPPPERFIASATGPTFWSEIPGRSRYVSRMRLRRVESLAVLEPGFDLDDWTIIDYPAAERDDHRDYNKLGGNARWLQHDDTPDEPGWRLLFQFTAASVGHELGDGAEAYGLIHEDGRGRFFVHSH
jgi:hypothetical protein